MSHLLLSFVTNAFNCWDIFSSSLAFVLLHMSFKELCIWKNVYMKGDVLVV